LTSSEPPPEILLCDTTPLRYFALVERLDLLAKSLDGKIRTPREVFDPGEDPNGPDALLSEIGRSERYWLKRSKRGEATRNYSRLHAMRFRTDIEVVDLDSAENQDAAQMQTPRFAKEAGLRDKLGKGEAAVIAVACARGWSVVMDDKDGRKALAFKRPQSTAWTTQELVRRAIAADFIGSPEAVAIYDSMLGEGYIGPRSLWDREV